MTPRRLRSLILPGTIAIACAAMLPVTMATAAPVTKGPGATTTPANGGLYGVWTLQSWTIGGQVLPCPVQLSLGPGAPSIGCGSATYLKLFRSGRYDTNLPVFEPYLVDEGVFVVADLGPKRGNVIVFDGDGLKNPSQARVFIFDLAVLDHVRDSFLADAGESVAVKTKRMNRYLEAYLDQLVPYQYDYEKDVDIYKELNERTRERLGIPPPP